MKPRGVLHNFWTKIRQIELFTAWASMAHATQPVISSEEEFELLTEGNRRFVQKVLLHPNRGPERWTQKAVSQKPFAIILFFQVDKSYFYNYHNYLFD